MLNRKERDPMLNRKEIDPMDHKSKGIFLGMVFAVSLCVTAHATPIVSPSFTPGTPVTTPLSLSAASGTIYAIFLYADAADRSILKGPPGNIFINQNPSADPIGTIESFSFTGGSISFELENTTTAKNYFTNATDVNGHGHAVSVINSTNLTSIALALGLSGTAISGQPGMSVAWATFLGLAGTAPITIVAWEDREQSNGSDWDYNDLIFAFAGVTGGGGQEIVITEPASLTLLGMALLGLGLGARRRRLGA